MEGIQNTAVSFWNTESKYGKFGPFLTDPDFWDSPEGITSADHILITIEGKIPVFCTNPAYGIGKWNICLYGQFAQQCLFYNSFNYPTPLNFEKSDD